LLAGAHGFYLSLLERVFHVKILCLRAVISFLFFVIAYRFYNILCVFSLPDAAGWKNPLNHLPSGVEG
jgi:hypothetical protein